MTRDIDEQKLTAYALGELQSPKDRAVVESRLAEEPSARRRVDQVRATARALAEALARESAADRDGADDLRLTDLQRAAIERRLVEPRPLARRANGRHWPLWGSVAASLAIVATVTATVVVPLLRGIMNAGTGDGMRPHVESNGAGDPAETAVPPRTIGPDQAGVARRPLWNPPAESPHVSNVPFPFPDAAAGTTVDDDDDAIARRAAGFIRVADRPVSTCPVTPTYPDDARPDRGSFAAIVRSIDGGALPAAELVRTEELVNALAGPFVPPNTGEGVSVNVETATCPWMAGHRLVRISLTADGERTEPAPATAPAYDGPAAREVSVRIEFNPRTAAAYRLIGYDRPATSMPAAATADPEIQTARATSIAPGRCATVLYEVIPTGRPTPAMQPATVPTRMTAPGPELLSVVLRSGDERTGAPRTSRVSAHDDARPLDVSTSAFRAAAAAAAFGMSLRDDPCRGTADYDLVARILLPDVAADAGGDGAGAAARKALIRAAQSAKSLSRPPAPPRNIELAPATSPGAVPHGH